MLPVARLPASVVTSLVVLVRVKVPAASSSTRNPAPRIEPEPLWVTVPPPTALRVTVPAPVVWTVVFGRLMPLPPKLRSRMSPVMVPEPMWWVNTPLEVREAMPMPPKPAVPFTTTLPAPVASIVPPKLEAVSVSSRTPLLTPAVPKPMPVTVSAPVAVVTRAPQMVTPSFSLVPPGPPVPMMVRLPAAV